MANDSRKRDFSFSSETRVPRWFGGEILDHKPSSVRMDFMKSGRAQFLMFHDQTQPIGVITEAAITRDKRGQGTVRFGKSELAQRALDDVDDGILGNTSVGYRVHEMVLESRKTGDGGDGESTYRITDWEPFEVSIVSVPADRAVGMGRSDGGSESIENDAAAAANQERETMSDKGKAAAGASAEGTRDGGAGDGNGASVEGRRGPSSLELEQDRKAAISNLCRASNIGDDIRDMWITSGTSVKVASDEIVRIMEDRGKQNASKVVSHLDLSEGDRRRFSVSRAIVACASENWKDAGFEAECTREIANRLQRLPDPKKFFVPYDVQTRPIGERALRSATRVANLQLAGVPPWAQRADTVGVASTGGYLVESLNVGFIELLRNRSVCFRLGARQLGGLVGNVNLPRQVGAATAYWLGSETTQIAENEQGFGQIALSPKNVGGYTEISRQLLLQSSPDVEGIVNADLAAIVALAVDKGALNGSGVAGQPLGIYNVSGVGVAAGGDMTTIAYKGQLDFQTAVANANVVPVSGGYATTPTVAALMMQRTRFANTNTPLWDGNLWDASGALGCAGFYGMSSNQIATGTMVFGDWAQLVIAEWGVLEIEVNPYANFQAGIIGVRAFMTLDVALRYPAAFCTGSSIT